MLYPRMLSSSKIAPSAFFHFPLSFCSDLTPAKILHHGMFTLFLSLASLKSHFCEALYGFSLHYLYSQYCPDSKTSCIQACQSACLAMQAFLCCIHRKAIKIPRKNIVLTQFFNNMASPLLEEEHIFHCFLLCLHPYYHRQR